MTRHTAGQAAARRNGKRAVVSHADRAAAWLSRVLQAHAAGRLNEVEELCRQALGRNPEEAGWLQHLFPDGSDIDDLAAVMELLHVVISVDSMPAHLAGALGRPCFILLSYVPDWRWLREGQTSAWYPTARLFRQTRAGDWSRPVGELAETLRAWPAQVKPAGADMNG